MTATDIHAEVTRTIREFYYDREAGSNRYRDLEAFEEKLEKTVGDISRRVGALIGEARRNPNLKPDDVERIVTLSRRTEARELGEALAEYKAERERFYNFDEDEVTERVAVAMAAE